MRYTIFLLHVLCILLNHYMLEAADTQVDVGAGYRQDKLVWKLGGWENGPPVASTLSWNRLQIAEFNGRIKITSGQCYYFRGSADYGVILRGENRDSDYDVQDESGLVYEWSRTDSAANKGYVYDASVAWGFILPCDRFFPNLALIPLYGYSAHKQYLHMYDGILSIWSPAPEFEGSEIKNLNSSYQALWTGSFLGADLLYQLYDSFMINGTFEYHWLKFHGKGHWNLREDIAGNFHHHGKGKGYLGALGINYFFRCRWYLSTQLEFQFARLKQGTDRRPCYTQNGVEDFSGTLHSVRWQSFKVFVSSGYCF